MKTALILLAGGIGMRMDSQIPKQYLPLQGTPIALHSLKKLGSLSCFHEIVIVCDPAYQSVFKLNELPLSFASPGPRRQDSALNGFLALKKEAHLLCFHDAVRPFVDIHLIDQLLDAAREFGAAALGIAAKSTFKLCNEFGLVETTVPREQLFEMQTPQAIKTELFIKGWDEINKNNITVTDDISIAECIGVKPKIILSSSKNIKITTPDDLLLASYVS